MSAKKELPDGWKWYENSILPTNQPLLLLSIVPDGDEDCRLELCVGTVSYKTSPDNNRECIPIAWKIPENVPFAEVALEGGRIWERKHRESQEKKCESPENKPQSILGTKVSEFMDPIFRILGK